MSNPYRREQIEGFVSDFSESTACRSQPALVQEYASMVLVPFLEAACAVRDVEPGEIEEGDLRPGLVKGVGPLEIPGSVQAHVPELVAAFLEELQTQGRLGGGFALARYVRVLKRAYLDAASGKPKPFVAPGSPLGRNDPCPCGSGRKYKKCCLGLLDP